ncbi:MAG: hypothetical protein ACP5MI_10140 [Candidatus Kryptoniota bacterium]
MSTIFYLQSKFNRYLSLTKEDAVSAIFLLLLVLPLDSSMNHTAQNSRQAQEGSVQALNAIVGTWKLEGIRYKTEFTDSGKAEAVSACQWAPNHNYVICDQIVTTPKGKENSLAIFAYDSEHHKYRYFEINARSGQPYYSNLQIHGSTWTFSSVYHGKIMVYMRTTDRFVTSSLIEYRVEFSFDQKHWTKMADGRETRIRR